MKIKLTRPFSGLESDNWRNLTYFGFTCFYLFLFILFIGNGARGSDYELFWSSGKIADHKGYSEIYSFSELKNIFQEYSKELGDYSNNETSLNKKFPVPYLSFFLVPFQFFSRLPMASGFMIWTLLNMGILFGYLLFFVRRIDGGSRNNLSTTRLIIPFLLSYSVYFNIMCGQVGVFILICTGEFVRFAVKQKPFLSGLWLGGLLIKPPLLILIVPIFMFMRYWKALVGFFVSSGIIVLISLLLSGRSGILALVDLWTKYGTGIATSDLQIMINWRMVGASINIFFNTSFGWAVASFGAITTILAVIFLNKQIPPYGSSSWVMKMTGVFAATLAATWYTLYHMATVLIPFLIYALIHKLLLEKSILSWCIVTPLIFLGTFLFEVLFFVFSGIYPANIHMKVIAFTGLTLNMIILFSVLKAMKVQNLTNNEI